MNHFLFVPRMQVGRSLFYYRGGSSKCKNSKTAYCDCSLPASSTSKPVCKKYASIYQQTEFEQSYRGWKELRHPNAQKCAKRKRRSSSNVVTLPDDNDALDYVYDPKPLRNVTVSWPTKSGKTAKSVTDYCKTAIKDSPPGKICAKINEFNFTTFMMQCVEDIKVTFSLSIFVCFFNYSNILQYTQKDLATTKEIHDNFDTSLLRLFLAQVIWAFLIEKHLHVLF